MNRNQRDQVLRYNATSGSFIDRSASGGGLSGATVLVRVLEPGTVALLAAGSMFFVVRMRCRR